MFYLLIFLILFFEFDLYFIHFVISCGLCRNLFFVFFCIFYYRLFILECCSISILSLTFYDLALLEISHVCDLISIILSHLCFCFSIFIELKMKIDLSSMFSISVATLIYWCLFWLISRYWEDSHFIDNFVTLVIASPFWLWNFFSFSECCNHFWYNWGSCCSKRWFMMYFGHFFYFY